MIKLFGGGFHSDKNILQARLEDALDRGMCPVCYLARDAEHRHIDMFLYERINDLSARDELAQSHGFCVYHTYQLLEIGGYGSHVKIAIIYKSLVDAMSSEMSVLQEDRPAVVDMDAKCPACQAMRESEQRYVPYMAERLGQEAFRIKYREAAGLCMRHFFGVYNASKRPLRAFLKDCQMQRLHGLSTDLGEFIRKTVVKNERFGEERDSWRRVLLLYAGTLKHEPDKPGNGGVEDMPEAEAAPAANE